MPLSAIFKKKTKPAVDNTTAESPVAAPEAKTKSPKMPTAGQTKISPIPMKFPEAMREVIKGNRITKLEWNDTNAYASLLHGYLKLRKGDGTLHNWIVSDGDMLGEDWVVV